ncbi:chloride channel protein [Streptomyces sp. NPDC002073]
MDPRLLLRAAVPALVVGVGASLLLLGVSELAESFKDVLWETLPDAVGLGRYSVVWILCVLTATGMAVGLVVWKVPGHAGPDPATTGLVDAPLPAAVVPSLLLASMLALAGGVSLGPENPITAANIALAWWLGRRLAPDSPAQVWAALAAAGTIGALFGTPVAAALVLSEMLATRPAAVGAAAGAGGTGAADGTGGAGSAGSAGGPGRAGRAPALWDRLFAPLVAAAAGGLTTTLIAHPSFELTLPDFDGPGWADLLAALVVASAGALAGLAAVFLFPYAHRAFGRLGHPLLMLPAGGLVLGLLGALGGPLTLFKGLDEVHELSLDPGAYSGAALLGMTAVKLVALTTASASGFRGGRIFPAVFAGVALGFAAHALVPSVHPTVGVTCAVLGVLMAVTRQGWLSLFTAAVLAGAAPGLIPLLCLASLPAWLLVSDRPQMQLTEAGTPLR